MKLTKAEKQFVLDARERLALDNKDWDKEPFLTLRDARLMSGYRRNQITSHPRWVACPYRLVYINTQHPDNMDAS